MGTRTDQFGLISKGITFFFALTLAWQCIADEPEEGTTDFPKGEQPLSLEDLGFSQTPPQVDHELRDRLAKRHHMLGQHQLWGLVALTGLGVTALAGPGAQSSDFHVGLGVATTAAYWTSAYFGLFAPPSPIEKNSGPLRLHKGLAWVHSLGMILTPVAGALARRKLDKGEDLEGLAKYHRALATVTGAALATAFLTISLEW